MSFDTTYSCQKSMPLGGCMSFIRVRNLHTDDAGNILSGSAVILESKYRKGAKHHCTQVIREPLGKIVWLGEDKKSGIFYSSSRGLVFYDGTKDTFSNVDSEDPRIQNTKFKKETKVHTVFGDVHWLLSQGIQHKLNNVLTAAFPDKMEAERVYVHLLHTILQNGNNTTCDNFYTNSVASHLFPSIVPSTLKTDTAYFRRMGDDKSRVAYFKEYIKLMRQIYPDFGKGCYVDSTPLPNEIKEHPLNALSRHGTEAPANQTRLVLILDRATGRVVWYMPIPGNINDINTLNKAIADVDATLDISLESFVLDAGYVSKELIAKMCTENGKSFIGRMPNRSGFHYREMFEEIKKDLSNFNEYSFVREGHAYFGKKITRDFFGYSINAYLYIDRTNAMSSITTKMINETDSLQGLDEDDRFFKEYEGGYFVLLSNIDLTPRELLNKYFGRTKIENVFKTSKEYLKLLPLCKWTKQTIMGKLLNDIICTNFYLDIRQMVNKDNLSVTEVISKLQSLMCICNREGEIIVETPNKKTKKYYEYLDEGIVPASVKVDTFRARLFV